MPLYFEQVPSVIVGVAQTIELVEKIWKLTWNLWAWVPPSSVDTAALSSIAAAAGRLPR